jgi:hypothetical protein
MIQPLILQWVRRYPVARGRPDLLLIRQLERVCLKAPGKPEVWGKERRQYLSGRFVKQRLGSARWWMTQGWWEWMPEQLRFGWKVFLGQPDRQRGSTTG